MRNNQFSKRVQGTESHSVPPGSSKLPIFPEDDDGTDEATDPLASDAPFLVSSEWPSSRELETALLESDPFPTSESTLSTSGEVLDFFGELEPPLPRDTLPSPPPVADEPTRIDIPRAHRLP
jgi:hypothetical protein